MVKKKVAVHKPRLIKSIQKLQLVQASGKRFERGKLVTRVRPIDLIVMGGVVLGQIGRREGARVLFLPEPPLTEDEQQEIYEGVCQLRQKQGRFGPPEGFVKQIGVRRDMLPPEVVGMEPETKE